MIPVPAGIQQRRLRRRGERLGAGTGSLPAGESSQRNDVGDVDDPGVGTVVAGLAPDQPLQDSQLIQLTRWAWPSDRVEMEN